MKMKEFRVGDIFSQERGKEKAPNQVALGNIPMINETSENNGFTKLCSPSKIFKGNCLTVSINYATTVFYQAKDFAASVNIAILRNDNFNEKSYLYVAGILKQAHKIYDYNHKISKDKLNDEMILLPVKNVISPDYELIENLAGGGIDMSKIDTSTWKEFKLGDLFDVENTWIYGKNKQYESHLNNPAKNSVAVISGVTTNNGVNYYTIDKLDDSEIYNDCLTISTRGEYSGTVTYHDEPFCLANNILVMPMPGLSKNVKLFIGTLISKIGYGGYNNYPTKDLLKENTILLPYKESEEIDYDFMEKYIRAIEKQTIAKLYEDRETIIEKTKEIVNQDN